MYHNKSSTSKSSFYSKVSKETDKSTKCFKNTPKRVIPSKSVTNHCPKNKCFSASLVETKKCTTRPKNTTKSNVMFTEKCQRKPVDYCKNCGDALENGQGNHEIDRIVTNMNIKSVRNDNNIRKKPSNSILQYYKNEKFQRSTESIQLDEESANKKHSLNTIREGSEYHVDSKDSILLTHSDSEEEITYTDEDDNIEKLKTFRNKNYFECHSAKSRIKNRGSVTSLNNHKCVYRFYLNDRLFPVPLNTDYNNKVRCVECHLPMDIKHDASNEKINGTIQAKVKLGGDTQDMVLLLPIKENLIIEERRKEPKINDEYVYFGVVKLGADGNSIFNRTLPEDSLALKYQKGYRQFRFDDRYKYKNVADDDVVVI